MPPAQQADFSFTASRLYDAVVLVMKIWAGYTLLRAMQAADSVQVPLQAMQLNHPDTFATFAAAKE